MTAESAAERRDHRIEHIATTKAKLTDEDSLAFFAAFLAGDVGPILTEIIAARVHAATVELLEQASQHYDERLEDIRREIGRQLAAQERRADRSAETIARIRELADVWEADCPGKAGQHRLCKGGRLRTAIAGTS